MQIAKYLVLVNSILCKWNIYILFPKTKFYKQKRGQGLPISWSGINTWEKNTSNYIGLGDDIIYSIS